MKRVKLLVLLLAVLMLATGCSANKVAKPSNASEVIFQVGDTKFTIGDLYETLKVSDSAYSVINNAGSIIADAEIETTNDIILEAKETVETYKESFGEDFLETIKYYGYVDEDDFYNSILTSIKSEKLLEKYIEEKIDSLFEKYSPVLAKMIYVQVGSGTQEEARAKAQEAYDKLTAGEDFKSVAEKYSSTASLATEAIYTREDDLDLNVASYLKTVTAPGLSSIMIDKSEKGFYIVQVTGTNRSVVEEAFIKYLKSNSEFTSEADSYFFSKHNFQIYDVDVYAYVKELFPSYLPESK